MHLSTSSRHTLRNQKFLRVRDSPKNATASNQMIYTLLNKMCDQVQYQVWWMCQIWKNQMIQQGKFSSKMSRQFWIVKFMTLWEPPMELNKATKAVLSINLALRDKPRLFKASNWISMRKIMSKRMTVALKVWIQVALQVLAQAKRAVVRRVMIIKLHSQMTFNQQKSNLPSKRVRRLRNKCLSLRRTIKILKHPSLTYLA